MTIPSKNLMKWGDYKFTVNTAPYEEYNRSTEYQWASHNRINSSPKLQFTGMGSDSLTLSGVIFTELSGIKQLDKLREIAAKGKSQLLIDGLGNVMGYWVLKSIDETKSTFFSDGVPRKQTFSLKFEKDEDKK